MDHNRSEESVSFGRREVPASEKPRLVGEVFAKVAERYDMMNDIMSFGTHRVFKRVAVEITGLQPGNRVLDLAGGTGDLSALLASRVGSDGLVLLTDPNQEMMACGRERLLDAGHASVRYCQAPGESLPFANQSFHAATISFGLRNFTSKETALEELYRVLKPNAPLVILEFSKHEDPLLGNLYKGFQSLWPGIGRAVVGDSQPYQYLVESIEQHPSQKALKQMLADAGFVDTDYHNLMGGVAAIHRGVRPA